MKTSNVLRAIFWAAVYAFLIWGACAYGQGSNGGILYASDFAAWSLPQGTGPANGMIAWPSAQVCQISTVGGYSFTAPKVGRKLTIVDNGVPAHTETVTPTQVTVGPGGCSLTATMSYSHLSYTVKSGTAGLQEAIDYQTGLPQGALVVLTPAWTLAGGTTGMITGAYGTSLVSISDQRDAVLIAYTWNGSAYVATSFGGSACDPNTIPNGCTGGTSLLAAQGSLGISPVQNIVKYGAVIDGMSGTDIGPAVQSAIAACPGDSGTGGVSCTVLLPCTGVGCYWKTQTAITSAYSKSILILIEGKVQLGDTLLENSFIVLQGNSGGTPQGFQNRGPAAEIHGAPWKGTMGTAITSIGSHSFTPTFTTGVIGNLSTNSWLTIVDPVTVTTIGTVTRTAWTGNSPNVSATLTSYTRMAPGSLITVSGCTDSSFNVTNTFVIAVNYQKHLISWAEDQAAGTTTGCTITGWNQDSFESTRLTNVGSSTLTATFRKTHLATAHWGIAGVALPAGVGPYELDYLEIQSATGAQFVTGDTVDATLIGDGFAASANVTSIGADVNLGLSTVRDVSVASSLASFWTCYTTGYQNCAEPSFPSGAWRCTYYGDVPNEGGCGHTSFKDTTFYGGFEADSNQRTASVSMPDFEHVEFRMSPQYAVDIDNRYGSSNPFQLDYAVPEDNAIGTPVLCTVGTTDGDAGYFVGPVHVGRWESSATYCLAPPDFNGRLIAWPTDNLELPVRPGFPAGTFDSGGKQLTEFYGQDAGLGPSVIPFATQAVNSAANVSGQCVSSGKCTVSTVVGPDGSADAIEIKAISDAAYPPPYGWTGSIATYAGDWILYGAKVRHGAGLNAPSSLAGNASLDIASFGTDSFIGNSPQFWQMGITLNGDWESIVGAATVVTGEATPHTVGLRMWPGPLSTEGNQFYNWFVIVVPGPNNPAWDLVTTGETIERVRRDLLHGAVPSSFNHPGIAVTLERVAAPEFDILTPATGAITPIAGTPQSVIIVADAGVDPSHGGTAVCWDSGHGGTAVCNSTSGIVLVTFGTTPVDDDLFEVGWVSAKASMPVLTPAQVHATAPPQCWIQEDADNSTTLKGVIIQNSATCGFISNMTEYVSYHIDPVLP